MIKSGHKELPQSGDEHVPIPHNLLIVHCHDLGQYLHCYGKTTVQSPNLDAFAKRAVRFENSFSTGPTCSPSRASIFTGRYPHNTGVLGLCHSPFGWDLNKDEIHMGQALSKADYRTAAIGIIHETSSGAERCGYQEYHPFGYAKAATDKACELLDDMAGDDKPFYLSVGFLEPHRLPYKSHKDWLPEDHSYPGEHLEADDELGVELPDYIADTLGARQEVAGLQGAIKHVDEQFGRIMARIENLGLLDNTVVVFTTDHGIAMPRAKGTLYDPGTKVALIMSAPGKNWQGGKVYDELILNIDLMPSLLNLLNVPVPPKVQGCSFVPLIEGETYEKSKYIFTEMTYHGYYDPMRAVRTERYKLIAFFNSSKSYMEQSQRRRPLTDPLFPAQWANNMHRDMELYDLKNDPGETNDVFNDPVYAEIRQDLIGCLYRQMIETCDPLLNGAVTSPQHSRVTLMMEETIKSQQANGRGQK